MRRLLIATCLGLACFAVLSAAQDPEPGKHTPNESERKIADATLARMQGLWQITEMRTPRMPSERRLEKGYVLINGLCLSIQIHSGYLAPDGRNVVNREFQAGMHRFELDSAGIMDTKSIIGSNYSEQMFLQFEAPKTARRYQVKFGEDQMTWIHAEGTTFVMKKQVDPPFVRRDIFGRPIKEKEKEKDGKEPK